MEYYHVYCRGIDKKDIFIDDIDYDRFMKSLWIFNDEKRTRSNLAVKPDRKILVDLMEFCLMQNHFHLLIRTDSPLNMGKFMQKLMTGYTMYFNKKYTRNGHLFESKYRYKYIDNDIYLRQVIDYIHNNPLKLKYPDYVSSDLLLGNFKLTSEAIEWLNSYTYSSRNYREIKPPLSITRSNLVIPQ